MFDTIMLFIFGLLLLIKGGDWFVDSATGIAHRFRVPELIIGATIVSIGTTLPEVMVSATSAVSGHGEIAYGNAIGSVICNTALIAAITIAVRPPKVDRKTFTLPVIFFFIAAVVYMISAYVFQEFSLAVGIVLLAVFVVYMVFTILHAIRMGKQEPTQELISPEAAEASAQPGTAEEVKSGKLTIVKDIVMLIVGAGLIALGANLLVNNGTKIAAWMGVPESVIALTFVALGTSLPELVTAITSLIKGHGALSLGNVIGANLFNLVFVSGISIVLAPFAVPASKIVFGINASLIIDLPVMLFVMMFLTLPAIIRGKLSRWQGITLLAVYAAFCVVQFVI
ncbi:MAG: calcium/sodium antiporter [Clostridiales bacterium]|nr:calcium/sodium antiporter [Clostridiales bacterium]